MEKFEKQRQKDVIESNDHIGWYYQTLVIGKRPRKWDIQWIGSGMDNTMDEAPAVGSYLEDWEELIICMEGDIFSEEGSEFYGRC